MEIDKCNKKEANTYNGNKLNREIRGLSVDERPINNINNDSILIVIDKGIMHYYDLENENWKGFNYNMASYLLEKK